MSNFQVSIFAGDQQEQSDSPAGGFEVVQHSRKGQKVVERIEALEEVWDSVVGKLTGLAEKSQGAAEKSQYELSEIQFNIGIEAGLNIGLVTKGDASVSIKFAKRPLDK